MIKGNEPAFPSTAGEPLDDWSFAHEGMSLRDWLAGKSITTAYGIVLSYMAESNARFQNDVAHHAYKLADAMLAERNTSK